MMLVVVHSFFFQAEDGIRYLVRSRWLGDGYKRQRSHDVPEVGVVATDAHDDDTGVARLDRAVRGDPRLSLIHI